MPKQRSKAELEKSVMSILLDDDVKIEKQHPDSRKMLSVDVLLPYADHPFKLYEGERLDDMVRSVKQNGVIIPIIVRPIGNDEDDDEREYEILSGHNRVNAAKIAGFSEVPVIIKKDLTDDEAKLIVTETNLVQRSFADLSHSERAVALKSHMDAISKQGKRNDLIDEINRLSNPDEIRKNETSDQLGRKLESREITAEKYGLSTTNVSRYIRLSYLTQSLIDRVDTGEIAFIPAVSLSYLSSDEQDELNQLLTETAYKVDMKKAESLREFSANKKLTSERMEQILSGELNKKPKPKTAPPFKLRAKIYQKYFDSNATQNEIETVIDQALTEYYENHKKEDNEQCQN